MGGKIRKPRTPLVMESTCIQSGVGRAAAEIAPPDYWPGTEYEPGRVHEDSTQAVTAPHGESPACLWTWGSPGDGVEVAKRPAGVCERC